MSATVKICGLQSTEMLESMLRLPVDQIGFVFASSRRRISPEQAGRMIRLLKERGSTFQAVGVFVNPTLEELSAVLLEAPLDVIQLSGSESPEQCAYIRGEFRLGVFKTYAVTASATQPFEQWLLPYIGHIDAVLLDTYDPQGGGSGVTFAWNVIPEYKAVAERCGVKLLVAGGLNADNVRDLLDEFRPDGVDVSSGVETDGVKDIEKITAFVERVKLT